MRSADLVTSRRKSTVSTDNISNSWTITVCFATVVCVSIQSSGVTKAPQWWATGRPFVLGVNKQQFVHGVLLAAWDSISWGRVWDLVGFPQAAGCLPAIKNFQLLLVWVCFRVRTSAAALSAPSDVGSFSGSFLLTVLDRCEYDAGCDALPFIARRCNSYIDASVLGSRGLIPSLYTKVVTRQSIPVVFTGSKSVWNWVLWRRSYQ